MSLGPISLLVNECYSAFCSHGGDKDHKLTAQVLSGQTKEKETLARDGGGEVSFFFLSGQVESI